MYWVNFLHIYQPVDQSKEILDRVVNESYRPLFKGLLKIPGIKINLNINASLTEILIKEGYGDVIKNIKKLARAKKLEFTESAKYHPLLPFLKKKEIIRQIQKNNKDNKKYFGNVYNPVCFFPPEMAYSSLVGKTVSRLGYKMIILDDISYNGGKNYSPKDKLFTVKGTVGLIAVFRERRVSNCIMSAVIRNKKEFINLVKGEVGENKYLCTAMDGETFGHHRPGLEKVFFKILDSKKLKQIFLSELPNYFNLEREISPLQATWASTEEDIEKGIQFYSWKDPKNKVHQLQWRFLNYLLSLSKTKKCSPKIQDKLDRTMASDQFFWASGEPWWSIEMIEKGSWTTLQTLKSLPSLTKSQIQKGKRYYRYILATAFRFQRSGKIEALAKKYKEAVKIPFKERTLGQGKPEVYYAFLELMRRKMQTAAKKKNFERAILWRDAIWKLETKNDIYDALHAVDLLRLEVPDPQLKKIMDRYKEKYKKIKPGQPELRKAL
ncbi:MAG: UvrB/UvrC motif-containing protein [Candidatus Nealsonbacteria bacterium]